MGETGWAFKLESNCSFIITARRCMQQPRVEHSSVLLEGGPTSGGSIREIFI